MVNVLSTCVQKFTVLIWVKFESGKKDKKKLKDIRDVSLKEIF